MDASFFDLDIEIEKFFGESIERLQKRFLTICSFRLEASKALIHLLTQPESLHAVIALPPSGLLAGYLNTVKKANGIVVAVDDTPESILERIVFYDIDSKPMTKSLSQNEKQWYLKDIKKDITYFGKSYKRAHLRVDIAGMDANEATLAIKDRVDGFTRQVLIPDLPDKN
jgi:shikimate kinase